VNHYRPSDERLVQKLYILRRPAPADAVAIGSSRLLQLTGADLSSRRFFNHAISGATMRDAAALYSLLRRRGTAPRVVVLGIDPWSFTPSSEDGLVHSLWAEYQNALEDLQIRDPLAPPPGPAAELRELVSLRSFQTAVAELMASRGHLARPVAEPTGDREGGAAIKRADGSLAYDASFRNRPAPTVRAEVERTLKTSPYLLNAFEPPDAALLNLADRLIALMVSDGATVILWRSPLHPVAYAALAENPAKEAQMRTLDAWCVRQAQRSHVRLAGAFNPGVFGLTDDDFYDALHPKPTAVARIAAQALPSAALSAAR
jgi:hypothetical protein